ncbi:hypothetical protein ACH35V_30880 [Actinomadura sp. 1N219]|uniref:hypothetical protein n=1 Tax=Actinomadura sp. 1N219 TaxID=3375152 RepID=UPI0037A415EE
MRAAIARTSAAGSVATPNASASARCTSAVAAPSRSASAAKSPPAALASSSAHSPSHPASRGGGVCANQSRTLAIARLQPSAPVCR